jgi:putative DNA primase/helicase
MGPMMNGGDDWERHLQAEAEREARAHRRYLQQELDAAAGPLSVEQGRVRFKEAFTEFMQVTTAVAYAIEVATGIGKTTIAGEEIARSKGTAAYLVPTHRLGDDIVLKHIAGARVFRGMTADMPGQEGVPDRRKMCDNLAQVEQALAAGLSVARSCCKNGKWECPFYRTCAYQAQKRDSPKVWIAAHEMLFHDQEAFGEPERVIVDEDFWESGLELPRSGIDVRDIVDDVCPRHLVGARSALARGLQRQLEEGGVARSCFEGVLSVEQCTAALAAEWRNIRANEKDALWPGMAPAQLHAAKEKLAAIRHDKQVVKMLEAVRELLQLPAGTVSGRLRIEGSGKARIVKVYGVKPVVARFVQAPTFIMSATLPRWEILSRFYPQVDTVGRIKVTTPYAQVRQVYGAPVTQRKFASDSNKHFVLGYILQRWHACDRQPTVVIAQKKYAAWLEGRLPEGVEVEHYNDIRGDDAYKGVRLLLCIGRTLPGPEQVELYAGILTGIAPKPATGKGAWGGRWYESREREIAEGVWLRVDWHPDKTAEAVRYQICEAELVQAAGRGRAVNRSKEKALDIDVLADVALPLKLDQAAKWKAVNPLIEMLIVEGILLLSARDLVRAMGWKLRTATRALRTLGVETEICPRQNLLQNITEAFGADIRLLRYQPVGVRQRWRMAYFAPAVLPDPRRWLESHIGPIERVAA